MQYNLHCKNTYDNLIYLKSYGYDPVESIHDGCLYIDSYLEPEQVGFTMMMLSKITGLFVTEKKLKAKELDYLYTLRNIQYRLGRFTREINRLIFSNK